MADEKQTTITFVNGEKINVIPQPGEIAAEVEKAGDGLIRVLDTEQNEVWVNPDHIVRVASQHVRRVTY